MKTFNKILVVILIAVTGAGVSEAKLRFGIKAGLNVNKMHLNEKLFDTDNGVGWTAGIMTQYLTVFGLGFDASLMYTHMNAELISAGQGSQASGAIENKNFIQIPINLKYKINLPVVSSLIAPYLFTGPDFAFKLGKSTINNIKTKTCQVAWNVGVGLELFKHLQIGGSYAFGINNVAENLGFDTKNPVKLKNNYWTVTAAYLF